MKLLFASDSFKGSLTALQITKLLSVAAKRVFGDVDIVPLPIADGGEGTVEALVEAARGAYRSAVVTGPLGEPVTATYGLIAGGRTAVIEAAQAAGLPLVPEARRDPRYTTSYGLGELMLDSLHSGAERLLIGIGGSATNDGGMGMLAALGARFTDEEGNLLEPVGASLARVARVELEGISRLLSAAQIDVICDVTNPLLGTTGATYVYSPQKGANEAVRDELELGMASYARVMSATLGRDIASFEGAGAAGGLGAALGGALGARLRPGADAVLEAAGFDVLIRGVKLAVTGEGRLDAQSVRYGKAPAAVARRCAAQGVPVLAIVGGMGEGAEELYTLADCSIVTTINAAMPIDEAIRDARALYLSAAERAFRLVKIGMGIG